MFFTCRARGTLFYIVLLRNHAVGAIDSVCSGVIVPVQAFVDCIPLLFGPCKGYARKSGATVERPIAYARHAVGYRYARKTFATGERILADTRHAVGYCDARKTSATAERTFV